MKEVFVQTVVGCIRQNGLLRRVCHIGFEIIYNAIQQLLVLVIHQMVLLASCHKESYPFVVVVDAEDAVVVAVVQLAVVDQGAEPAVEVYVQGVFVLDGLRRGCHDCQEQHDYGQESTGDDCQQRCSGVAVRRSRAVGRGGNNDAFHSARV